MYADGGRRRRRRPLKNITAPSPMLAPPTDESLQWRFLAHMNANLLPLASAKALRQTLSLYVPRGGGRAGARRGLREKVPVGARFLVRGRGAAFPRARLPAVGGSRSSSSRRASSRSATSGCSRTRWTSSSRSSPPINTYTRLVLTVSGTDEKWEWAPRLGKQAADLERAAAFGTAALHDDAGRCG